MRHAILVCACLLVSVPAWAQNGTWEFEVHAGGAFVSNGGGAGSLPAPGESFTTLAGALPSRRVSSWFFGDGAALINEVLASLPSQPAERITSLDAVLTSRLADRGNGGDFGIRVGRGLTPRYGIELNLDVATAATKLTSAARAGIEASRDSFVPAVRNGLLAGGPFTDIAVASGSTIGDGTGRQITATGALNVNLATDGRVIPYTTLGAGVIVNTGDAPVAGVDGSYSFNIGGVFPVDERDSVSVSQATDSMFIGVVGGGVKALVTERSGFRFDVRVHVGGNSARTVLAADPEAVAGNPAASVATQTSPGIQFSNDEAAVGPTTLSGPAISGFETFSADGVFSQVLVTVGYFWSF